MTHDHLRKNPGGGVLSGKVGTGYTCGFVLTCMQTEEFEMHASTKIIVVTGFTTELHAGRQRGHFSILQPFLLTTYGNNRRLEDIVSDK